MKKEIETYFYLDGLSIVVEDLKKENNDLKKELIKTNDELIKLKKTSLGSLAILTIFVVVLTLVVLFK